MYLSICVQHHPSRELPAALTRYEVVADPDPNGPRSALRTYIECLRVTPSGYSHRLVLQDDVQLVTDFASRAHQALSERPHDIVAFFVPRFALHGRWMRDAAARGDSWCALPTSVNWAPAVATAWPVELASDFVEFASEHVARRRARGLGTLGDDPVIGAFARARKLTVWATVPCLVQHPDVGWSLAKNRDYNGTNPARQAAVFVDD